MIVHIHPGSVLLDHIAAADIEGDALEWSECLLFGPTPRDGDWYEVRARALAELSGEAGPYRQRLEAQDRALAQAAADADNELVMWFGPELFCQTNLIAVLARIGQRPRVSLISPGDLPGKPRGCTVSYLDADELRAAFAVRSPALAPQFDLAARAWDAWRADDQRKALGELLEYDLSALPHLSAAVERWLLEPARTDEVIDAALRKGVRDWNQIFREVQNAEARPWMTDQLLLHRLAARTRSQSGP